MKVKLRHLVYRSLQNGFLRGPSFCALSPGITNGHAHDETANYDIICYEMIYQLIGVYN